MASVYLKRGTWYLRVKNTAGAWVGVRSAAKTKTEARRLAEELERKAERVRMGLEVAPATNGGGTVADLLRWWLDAHASATASFDSTRYMVERHLIAASLGRQALVAVTPGAIEALLKTKSADLASDLEPPSRLPPERLRGCPACGAVRRHEPGE
jgi:hypothetical protein